jgi:hypothetical protein
MFFFMTTNKKKLCCPLCFFSWRPIKNDSVTPYVFFHDDQSKTTVLPLMFFFMTTKEKQQCYPLRYFSWRRKKDNSVTLYVLFDKYRHSIRWLQPDLNPGLQGVRQSALHCTTEAMTIHNNQSSIKRIYKTLKCKCVFLLFPLCFLPWGPI